MHTVSLTTSAFKPVCGWEGGLLCFGTSVEGHSWSKARWEAKGNHESDSKTSVDLVAGMAAVVVASNDVACEGQAAWQVCLRNGAKIVETCERWASMGVAWCNHVVDGTSWVG